MMTTGQHLTPLQLGTWMASLSMLGVIVAIPMKRNMINIEQLRFPSGIATATTLKSMHAKGADGDVRLAAYDVVYVPKSGIAEVYKWYNQYVQQFANPSFGFSYLVAPEVGTSAVITQTPTK